MISMRPMQQQRKGNENAANAPRRPTAMNPFYTALFTGITVAVMATSTPVYAASANKNVPAEVSNDREQKPQTNARFTQKALTTQVKKVDVQQNQEQVELRHKEQKLNNFLKTIVPWLALLAMAVGAVYGLFWGIRNALLFMQRKSAEHVSKKAGKLMKESPELLAKAQRKKEEQFLD